MEEGERVHGKRHGRRGVGVTALDGWMFRGGGGKACVYVDLFRINIRKGYEDRRKWFCCLHTEIVRHGPTPLSDGMKRNVPGSVL